MRMRMRMRMRMNLNMVPRDQSGFTCSLSSFFKIKSASPSLFQFQPLPGRTTQAVLGILGIPNLLIIELLIWVAFGKSLLTCAWSLESRPALSLAFYTVLDAPLSFHSSGITRVKCKLRLDACFLRPNSKCYMYWYWSLLTSRVFPPELPCLPPLFDFAVDTCTCPLRNRAGGFLETVLIIIRHTYSRNFHLSLFLAVPVISYCSFGKQSWSFVRV